MKKKLGFFLLPPLIAGAQTMSIEEYEPKSTLVVPSHHVSRAKYPFIDIHSHQNGQMPPERLDQLVRDMDALNLRILVNLSGGTGDRLKNAVANMKGRYPDRFALFCTPDYRGIDDPGWGERAAAQLEKDVRNGAQGLKIFKNLGLTLAGGDGKRIPVDDARFDPLWAMAGKLKIPVLIHTGEPAPFFQPHDRFNERWLELKQIPSRARPPDRYPSWETIMGEQRRVFRKHPGTVFINAHLGWLGGNLGELGRQLDEMPNVHVDIAAVLAELGRQPRFARRWFIRYQDRVLFGKDTWAPSEFPTYFRVLETADEYFDYYRKRHAFWKMYGLDLSDAVLKKVYYKNALRLVPGLNAAGFPE